MASRTVTVNLIGHDRLSQEFDKAGKSANRFRSTLSKIGDGNSSKGLQTAFLQTSALTTAITAMAPAALPVFAAVSAGAAGMGAAFGAAGVAAAGFAAVAKSQLSEVTDVTKKMEAAQLAATKATTDKARQAALKEETRLWNTLTPAQQRAATQIRGIRTEWQKTSDSLARPVLDAITPWIAAARRGLGFLPSLVKPASVAIQDLGQRAKSALADPFWKQWFAQVGSTGAAGISVFGTALGNLTQGFAALFQKFLPIGSQMLPKILQLAQGFNAWANSAKATQAINRFFAYVQSVAPKVLAFFQTLGPAILNIWRAIMPLAPVSLAVATALAGIVAAMPPGVLTAMVAGFVALKIATAAWSVAMWAAHGVAILVSAVTKVWTAAQWLLNAALTANPIGIVIVAVAALVAGIILLWKHSETFRNIVMAAWAGIKTAALAAWNSALKPIFNFIKFYIMNILVPQWKFLWAVVKVVWSGIVAAVKFAWPILQAIFGFIKFYIMNIVVPQLKFLWAVAKVVWAGIVAAVKFAWFVIKVIWGAIKTSLMTLKFALMVVVASWKLQWKGISTIVRAVWNSVLKPVWNAIKNTLSGPLSAAFSTFKKVASTVWTAVKSVITSVWNSGIKPAFNKIKEAVGAVRKAFHTATDAIGRKWNELKSKTKGPVSFVVNTVYNKGIRRVWNFVAGIAGMGKLGEVKGFAKGGILPGYSRKDDRLIMARSGEGILTPEAVQGLGPRFVERANSAGRSAAKQLSLGGDPKSGFGIPGFASGGIIGALKGAANRGVDFFKNAPKMLASKGIGAWAGSILNPMKGGGGGSGKWGSAIGKLPAKMITGFMGWIKKKIEPLFAGGPGIAGALQWAKTQRGKPYRWGGVGPGGYDCSGFMSAITNKIKGKPLHRRLFTTHSFNGRSGPGGFVRNAPSGFKVGVTNAGVGHMAGTLGNTAVESSGSAGVRVGGGARGATNGLFSARYGLRADTGNLVLSPGWNPPVYNGTGRMEVLETSIGSKGGNTYNISVNVAAGANPAEAGRQIVSVIKEYERRSGKGWRS